MKRYIFFILCIAFVFPFCVEAASSNLVIDGSFENSVTLPNGNWIKESSATFASVVVDNASLAHSGNKSAKLTARTNSADALWSTPITIKRNRTYEYSVWVKTPNVLVNQTKFTLYAAFKCSGAISQWTHITGTGNYTFPNANEWTKIVCKYNYNPPTGVGEATVQLKPYEYTWTGGGATLASELWVDDSSVVLLAPEIFGVADVVISEVTGGTAQYTTNMSDPSLWSVTDILGSPLTNGITIGQDGKLTIPKGFADDQEILVKLSGMDYGEAVSIEKKVALSVAPDTSRPVICTLDGTNVLVRTHFSSDKDLVQKIIGYAEPTLDKNNPIDFTTSTLIATNDNINASGTILANDGDEATPFRINDSYIGANHGQSNGVLITSVHGKTSADIGSLWKDANNINWTLLKIISSDKLLFLSENRELSKTKYKFYNSVTGNLTYVSHGSNTNAISISSQIPYQQILPANRYISKNVYAVKDKIAKQITSGKLFYCDYIDIVESYDIINPATIGETLRTNRPLGGYTAPQSMAVGEAIIKYNITYRILADGTVLSIFDHEMLDDVVFTSYGGLQYMERLNAFSGGVFRYHPKAKPFTIGGVTYNFTNEYNITQNAVPNFQLTPQYWEVANSPVDRQVSYMKDAQGKNVVGFVGGFLPVLDGNPENRKANIEYAYNIWNSKKSYPSFIGAPAFGNGSANRKIQGVAYKKFENMQTSDEQIGSKYTISYAKDCYIYLDYKKEGTQRIPLEQDKVVTLIEKSDNVSYKVTENYIDVTVQNTSPYGYLVLKSTETFKGKNLVIDNSFEQSISFVDNPSWELGSTTFNAMITADDAYSGTKSARLTGRTGFGDTISCKPVEIQRNRMYEYSAWVKVPEGVNNALFTLQALFRYTNKNGTVLSEWKTITGGAQTIAVAGEWCEIKCNYTYEIADKSYGTAMVQMDVLEYGAITSEIWLDDYSIKPKADALIFGANGVLSSDISNKITTYTTTMSNLQSWSVDNTAQSKGVTIVDGNLFIPAGINNISQIIIMANGIDNGEAKTISKTVIIGEKINLIKDYSFDESIDFTLNSNWGVDRNQNANVIATVESTDVHSGIKVAKITGRVRHEDSILNAPISIPKDRAYEYSAWAKIPQESTTTAVVNLRILPSWSYIGNLITLQPGKWQELKTTYTLSNNTDIRLSVQGRGTGSVAPEIWVDDYGIKPVNMQNSIEITGVSGVFLPESGEVEYAFQAIVKNQNGTITDMSQAVDWSIENNINGVSIDAQTGVLKIDENADLGTIIINAKITEYGITTLTRKEVAISVIDVEAVRKATNQLTDVDISNEDLNAITKNLNLPSNGNYETQIVWTSSNPQVVSTEGVIAPVQNEDKSVILTAHITKGNASATKDFYLNVSRIGEIVKESNFDNIITITGTSVPWIHLKNYTGQGNSNATYKIVQEAGRGNVAKISNRVDKLDTITQGIDVQTNTDYKYSVWVKTDNATSCNVTASGFGMQQTTIKQLDANSWTKLEGVLNFPSEISHMIRIYLFVNEFQTVTNTMYIDDFKVSLNQTKARPFGVDFNLKDSYNAITGATVAERFAQRKAELPNEITTVEPFKVAGQTQIFVSPSGNDTATGSIENPLQTLAEALKRVSNNAQGVVIYLRGGNYEILDTITIDNTHSGATDAPLFISAYGDEKPIFVHGETISPSAFAPVTDPVILNRFYPYAQGKILVADLQSLGIQDYGSVDGQVPLLLFNNQKATLARWPNAEEVTLNGVLDVGPVTEPASPYYTDGVNDGRGFEYTVDFQRPFHWNNTGDLWLYGSFFAEFHRQPYKIRSINQATNSIRTVQHCPWGAQYKPVMPTSHYYYNIMEELDVPGEWYLDRDTGKLYIYPISDMQNAQITLSTHNNTMLSIVEAENVIINNITFQASAGTGISIIGGSQNIIQNCIINNISKTGVEISGKKNGVIYTDIYNIGESAVITQMGTIEEKAMLLPMRNFVQNCFVYEAKYGIFLNGIGNIASHNLFQRTQSPSIYLQDSIECIAEYNEISGGPYLAKDAGGVYILGLGTNRGNHIRYNYLHNPIRGLIGLYCDDMSSDNYLYGNIVDGGEFSVQIGGGKENVVTNNIFLNATGGGERDYLYYYGTSWEYLWIPVTTKSFFTKYMDETSRFHYVDVSKSPWAERFTTFLDYTQKMTQHIAERKVSGYIRNSLEDYLRAPTYNHYQGNLLVNTASFQHSDIDLQTATGVGTNYETTENPGFVNMLEKNYNLIGFNRIAGFITPNFNKMGLIANDFRVECPIVTAPQQIAPLDLSMSKDEIYIAWSPVIGAENYQLKIATDADFAQVVFEIDTPYTYYTLESLQEDTQYYWKVVAKTEAKSISVSKSVNNQVFSFKTASSNNDITVNALTIVDGKIYAVIYKATQEERTATPVIALYDMENSLVEMSTDTILLKQGINLVNHININKENMKDGWVAKAFIFDGLLSKIKPLVPAYTKVKG